MRDARTSRGGLGGAIGVAFALTFAGCGDEQPTEAEMASARAAEAGNLLSDTEAAIGDEDRYAPELADAQTALRRERAELRDLAAGLSGSDAEAVQAEIEALDASLRDASRRAGDLSAPHPVGPLRGDGLGPVDFGAPSAKAMAAFGEPDREQEVGFGTGIAPRFDWIYTAEPDMRVIFDATSGELAGYQCGKGCGLETETQIGVGDSMSLVRSKYDSQLEDYPVGAGALIVPAGRGLRRGGLIFSPDPEDGDTVTAISAFDSLAGPAGD